MQQQSRIWQVLCAALSAAAFACSGGNSGDSEGGRFLVEEINVPNDGVWFINRAITIRFDGAVDFSTVNLNTINLREVGGAPAVGEFRLLDPRTVAFQPRCPRRSDLSDAGLKPGGVLYELRVLSAPKGSELPVRSAAGSPLALSETRRFRTPAGADASDVFFDTRIGAPRPVVRARGSGDSDATHLELGGDPERRRYFERDDTGRVELAGPDVPLNLLSDGEESVALVIAFDQPVQPFDTNVRSERLPWQYRDQDGFWQDLATRITLEQNCASTGAVVRIEPLGALPSGAELRAVVTTEFADLVGDTNSLAQTAFAPARVRRRPEPFGDALEEEFLVGGDDPLSKQDVDSETGEPFALWEGGELRAGFSFEGTGGPGGDFDWEVPEGEFFVLNTSTALIVGGPNFEPTRQQVVVDGVVDVRNLRVAEGAVLKIEGPNPCKVLASGSVEILGRIDVSGTSNVGVVSINTTALPEPGSPGQAGGGKGGTGSPRTNSSTPRGGRGFGAFNVADGGGNGGETGWNDLLDDVEVRRGAGGGGGRFGPDQFEDEAMGLFDQTFIGLDAEPGFDNLTSNPTNPGDPPARGAESGQIPPVGGEVGPTPFIDLEAENDFFGFAFLEPVPGEGRVVQGELDRPHAGSGGGAGGDASFTNTVPFPAPWNPAGDEKGAGGGGGGGALRVLALGNIRFGASGQIVARGGSGGGGENTSGQDRVGGGSGGGAGGHVILESASRIDMSETTGGPAGQAILATGGQGGAGADNQGGAQLTQNGQVETAPTGDACPVTMPPQNVCRGHIDGAGGDGGPGRIQLHTPGGLADVLLPTGTMLAEICQPAPVHMSATARLIPSFGRVSSARSIWVPLGLGGFDPDASSAPSFERATYAFGDVDPATGRVRTTGEVVETQPALLGPEPLRNSPLLPSIDVSGRTLRMDASALKSGPQRKYFENPGLLDHFVLELSQAGGGGAFQRYDVVSVAFEEEDGSTVLALSVAADGPLLTSFTASGGVEAALIPSFFRVSTGGNVDVLPDSATVEILFQATTANDAGLPDVDGMTPFVADPSILNDDPNNADFRFLRFRVKFDIDALGEGLSPSSPIPSLRFLRIPFQYE